METPSDGRERWPLTTNRVTDLPPAPRWGDHERRLDVGLKEAQKRSEEKRKKARRSRLYSFGLAGGQR